MQNFFEQLSKYLFKEDDFYNIEETDNYILLKNVINSGYLTDKKYSYLQDSKYVLYSNKIIEEILNKLFSYNFTFNEALKIQSMGKILKDRISLLNYNNKEETNQLINSLMEKINNCIEIKNKIQTVIKFYQYFYQKDYKKVENIENLNLKLSGEKIKNFSKYKEEIDLVLKDFDESIKSFVLTSKRCLDPEM